MPGNFAAARRRHPAAALLLTVLIVSLAACVGQVRSTGAAAAEPAPFRAAALQPVLADGFARTRAVYLDPVRPARLAMQGLEGLATIDPALSCRIEGGSVTLYRGAERIAATPRPPDESPPAWAAAVVAVLAEARRHAPRLAGAPMAKLRDVMLAGMTATLDRYSRYADPQAARAERAARRGTGRRSPRPATLIWRRIGSVGYLRLNRFDGGTADSVRAAVAALVEAGTRGLILDLRNNPGGLLRGGVRTADLFLDEGPLLAVAGRHPESHASYEADAARIAGGLPLVVLVNAGSASAAEIVAGSLVERGRAVMVGSRTHGKNVVQVVEPMAHGGELVLSWARFRMPAGTAVGPDGLTPALCTSRDGQARLRDMLEGGGTHCPRSHHVANADLILALALLRDSDAYDRALARQVELAAAAKEALHAGL